MEEPEKILEQAVDEMQGDLTRVRQSYAQVLATQRRAAEQKRLQDGIAQSWHERAELAVQKGNDKLAKEALTRRQAAMIRAADLERQLQGMEDNVDRLFDAVQALEAKICEAKDQKEQLVARARTAKATAEVNDMLSDVGQSGGAGAFDRMKEKVEMLEASADVSQVLLGIAPSSLEDQFQEMEAGSAISDELARLNGLQALPGSNRADALDSELEAMRKKFNDAADE